jgi:hypothetical protein
MCAESVSKKSSLPPLTHVVFTRLMFALATAYLLSREQEAPVGWQRWRPQLQEQTRDLVIVFAQHDQGIFHLAEYSLLLGINIKDRPPVIGPRPKILAKYRIPGHR